ncbi:MAG TPA: SusD/RagB family nutrient-binding outer membrane lipoprotein [Membranihabitans sp.]|nr:SusD/RagB family nutrient-binding outer membrane lipoprotein [Membranihabitans sp.]HLW50338.1 SusD/RagB family nutrient-binding outer membrane lipoprotein [Sphingobacteriaceae bacterium]
MKSIKRQLAYILTLMLIVAVSCEDLDELNINPNGVDPSTADLNLLMPTIITSVGQNITGLGFGDLAGVMQHTQKDGWSSGHNDYDWNNLSHNWAGWYGILRNNEEMYNKAVEEDYVFHQGVALVMRAYTFGMIADLWGAAPYDDALKAEESSEFFKPKYNDQKYIYTQILADLEEANNLLSGPQSSYSNIEPSQDLLYGGNVSKWRKFSNSLALRYNMRLSAKEPELARSGISNIVSNPEKYPLILSSADDANVAYSGNSPGDSWPSSEAFESDPSSNYMRVKMCATLVDTLLKYEDPRIGVWANKVGIPLKMVPGEQVDRIVGGVREVSSDVVEKFENDFSDDHVKVNFNPEYVGIPAQIISAGFYNMNPSIPQGVYNPHVSQLADMYKESTGPLLVMRLMSAAEVHFILSEAAEYGWGISNPEEHYAAGIRESFNAWGVGNQFSGYVDRAPYNGLESIITQKWIASWTAAAESWFDYRRTGLPHLRTGVSAKRQALPLRFYYHFDSEISKNTANAEAAIDQLEPTQYKGSDVSNNSAWSKMWLLQGTGKPY